MKIDNQTKVLILFNVAALAVAIIGVVALSRLGACTDGVPLKGIVMMGSPAAFFGAQILYLLFKKKSLVFYPPVDGKGNYSVSIPGFKKPIEFRRTNLLDEKISNDHFIVYSEGVNSNLNLFIGIKTDETVERLWIAEVKAGTLTQKWLCKSASLLVEGLDHQEIVEPIDQQDRKDADSTREQT